MAAYRRGAKKGVQWPSLGNGHGVRFKQGQWVFITKQLSQGVIPLMAGPPPSQIKPYKMVLQSGLLILSLLITIINTEDQSDFYDVIAFLTFHGFFVDFPSCIPSPLISPSPSFCPLPLQPPPAPPQNKIKKVKTKKKSKKKISACKL